MITWRLKNMLLKTSGSMMKSRTQFENTLRKMKTQPYKIYSVEQEQFLEGST